jgi:hypothetical protein
MRAKLLVLVGVVGLVGVAGALAMPGCSSDTPDAPVDGGIEADAPVVPEKEAGDVEAPDTGPAKCPTTTPITAADVTPKWQPPPAVQTVCTQQNIDALKAAYKSSTNGNVSFSIVRTSLGVPCSDCVFSQLTTNDGGTATTWSVFVENDADAGTAIDNRTASCLGRRAGDACGNARHQFETCLRLGCKSTDCVSAASITQCKKDVQSGACKTLTADYMAACPNEPALATECNLFASIAYGCAGGADAGIDAAN